MIKQTNANLSTLDFDFILCKNLAPDNCWVRLADQIPWDVLGNIYEESLSPDEGAPSIPARVVISALIIKHIKNLSDEETIEDIRENPYYQYFLGYNSFHDRQVFAPSLLVEIRKRKPRRKTIRKAVGKQLSYIRRDLKHIDRLLDECPASPFPWSYKMQCQLWIIKELFRQQEIMHRTKTHSVAHRIVSISQPHVCPIVRGKAKAKTEFGAKISASVIDDKFVLDRLEWDAYNECTDLLPTVERYKERFGFYPETVNADKIYWNRENRRHLKSLDIALYGGNPLGRPIKNRTPQERKTHKAESVKRNRIACPTMLFRREGRFGTGKRRYGLGLVMAKTKATSESWIAMVIFVMNVAGACHNQLFSLFFPFKWFGWVVFRSTFHDSALKLSEKLDLYLGVRSPYQLQNVDRLQITTF